MASSRLQRWHQNTGFLFWADVLASEVVPRVLSHVRGLLLSKGTTIAADVFESDPGSQFWMKMMGNMKDSYAVERTSEELLRGLATERINDTESYWVIWILVYDLFYNKKSVRYASCYHCYCFDISRSLSFYPLSSSNLQNLSKSRKLF